MWNDGGNNCAKECGSYHVSGKVVKLSDSNCFKECGMAVSFFG